MEKGIERRKICDALKAQKKDQRVRLLVEDLNGYQKMWQLRSQSRQLHIIDIQPPTSQFLAHKVNLSNIAPCQHLFSLFLNLIFRFSVSLGLPLSVFVAKVSGL